MGNGLQMPSITLPRTPRQMHKNTHYPDRTCSALHKPLRYFPVYFNQTSQIQFSSPVRKRWWKIPKDAFVSTVDAWIAVAFSKASIIKCQEGFRFSLTSGTALFPALPLSFKCWSYGRNARHSQSTIPSASHHNLQVAGVPKLAYTP